jgi:hypothetical protein
MLGRKRKTGKHRRNGDRANTKTYAHGYSIGAGRTRATLCAMHGNPGRIRPVDSFRLACARLRAKPSTRALKVVIGT